MKAVRFLFLVPMLALIPGWVPAQTDSSPAMPPAPKPHVADVPQPNQPGAPAPTPGDVTDPAKIADFEKRFAQGQELEKEGKPTEALAVFEGILAEAPQARGSLREAGYISLQQNNLVKADGYFEKLHTLVPDYPAAIESLIQVNQALKRDVKVERLITEFKELHESGRVPEFTQSLSFVRERIHRPQDEVIVSQFFDYTDDPNTVWMAEIFDTGGHLKRRVLLNYDADATKALRAKDPKYAATEIFTWLEHVIKGDRFKEVDVYMQIFALPDYAKFRSAMMVILESTPKPIYTAPVDLPVQ